LENNVRPIGVEFPGRARELQLANATAALIRELGDNYEVYHDFIAREIEAMGSRPQWNHDKPDVAGFAAAWGRIDDLLQAEAFLRVCRAHRKEGRSLAEGPKDAKPFVDGHDRLLSAVSGEPIAEARRSGEPRQRPPHPPWVDEFFPGQAQR
jgi:hypothetical protein